MIPIIGLVLYCLMLYSIVGWAVYMFAEQEVRYNNSRKAAIVALLSPVWPLLIVWGILYFVWRTITNINAITKKAYRKVEELWAIATEKEL